MFYYFEELPSTIDEARDEKYSHGDVIVAEHQTAGRGQRGKKWSSPSGENLMLSAVLDTSFLRTDEQFLLLQVVALALVDTFALYGLDARIKWANDIYIGDRKITGVLIDHTLAPREAPEAAGGPEMEESAEAGKAGGMLSRSGVGIGINVNQRVFEEWLPNPTSMALETGREYDRREVLKRFVDRLGVRFETLRRGEKEALRRDYHSKIWRLGTPARYVFPDGEEFTGTIRGVGPGGELAIETPDGVKNYLFHEVSFII
jgi:BirA family biotin operon repressor/biotin-[acetyl-CoA-carboxylase] ligase